MASFTDDEKKALKSIFKAKGFLGLQRGSFKFKGGVKTSSDNVFWKKLGFPDSFSAPELRGIRGDILSKDLDSDSLENILEEWTLENLPKKSYCKITVDGGAEETPTPEYIKGLLPVVNIGKDAKDKIILLDPNRNNRPALGISPDVYLLMAQTTLPELAMNDEILKVMTDFDPRNLNSVYYRLSKCGSFNMPHVNYYIPPQWRFVEVTTPAYEGDIKRLIDHLFPDDEEREYVLDWLHYAIVDRNETVLCLIGARGTGKGVFNDILGNLVGNEYREVVGQAILTDKFNGAFKNKRLIFFDEVNISSDTALEKFKAFCNGKISVESKGVDSETIENHTSLVLASNDRKEFKAEPQERRFSVPRVTDRPLLDIMTELEIAEFVERINDPDSVELATFGNWLIDRKPTHSQVIPLKGEYYFEICKLSMAEWKTFLIDYMMNEGEKGVKYSSNVISKAFKRKFGDEALFPTKKATIQEFLSDYRHAGKYRVARLEEVWDNQRSRETYRIVPEEDFLDKFGKAGESEIVENALDEL